MVFKLKMIFSMFIISVSKFCSSSSFLVSLLLLEVISVSLYGILCMYMGWLTQISMIPVSFLTFVVCESVLGLSLLILSSRLRESVKMSSFTS